MWKIENQACQNTQMVVWSFAKIMVDSTVFLFSKNASEGYAKSEVNLIS